MPGASSFPERLLWHIFPSLSPSPSLSLPSGMHVPIIHTHPTHTHTTYTPFSVLPFTSAVDPRLNFDKLLFFLISFSKPCNWIATAMKPWGSYKKRLVRSKEMPLPLLRAHNSIRTYPCIGYYLAFLKHLLQAQGESPGRRAEVVGKEWKWLGHPGRGRSQLPCHPTSSAPTPWQLRGCNPPTKASFPGPFSQLEELMQESAWCLTGKLGCVHWDRGGQLTSPRKTETTK